MVKRLSSLVGFTWRSLYLQILELGSPFPLPRSKRETEEMFSTTPPSLTRYEGRRILFNHITTPPSLETRDGEGVFDLRGSDYL